MMDVTEAKKLIDRYLDNNPAIAFHGYQRDDVRRAMEAAYRHGYDQGISDLTKEMHERIRL